VSANDKVKYVKKKYYVGKAREKDGEKGVIDEVSPAAERECDPSTN